MATSQVQSMVFDKAGRLWMAMVSDGVMVYDPAGDTTPTRARTGRAYDPGLAGRASVSPRLVRRADGSWGQGPVPRTGGVDAARAFDLQGRAVLPPRNGP